MKKITQKEVKEVWGDTFKTRGFNIAKSYITNEKLFHCFRQHGEGMDEALYNNSYDISVDLKDIILDSDDMYKTTFIKSLQEAINEMIEEYNKNIV